ncbi:hypothetical protein [Wolbachia endosymbiont (group A) of Sphecodes monilicornis]|nr:hypothetical protein [Wolbachia endosymbiont (group A) of Sphecodes monilicornis]
MTCSDYYEKCYNFNISGVITIFEMSNISVFLSSYIQLYSKISY